MTRQRVAQLLLLMMMATIGVHGRLAATSSTINSMHLRGGENNDDDEQNVYELVYQRLNHVPTFVLVFDDGDASGVGFVGLNKESQPAGWFDHVQGESLAIFFLEPKDAMEALEQVQADSDTPLPIRIGTEGLGNALAMCNGFAGCDDGAFLPEIRAHFDGIRLQAAKQDTHMVIRGERWLTEKFRPALETALKGAGIIDDAADAWWTLPVFLGSELNRPDHTPMFLNPHQVRIRAKEGASNDEKDRTILDLEKTIKLLDIRMVVRDLGLPWSTVRFHGSAAAPEFASTLKPAMDWGKLAVFGEFNPSFDPDEIPDE